MNYRNTVLIPIVLFVISAIAGTIISLSGTYSQLTEESPETPKDDKIIEYA